MPAKGPKLTHKLLPAETQKIIDLYKKGLPVPMITARFDITKSYVSHLMRRRGVRMRQPRS